MPVKNPLAAALEGYVQIKNEGPAGLAVGGYASSADKVRKTSGSAVVHISRARQIARQFHGWDVPTDDELATRQMRGI